MRTLVGILNLRDDYRSSTRVDFIIGLRTVSFKSSFERPPVIPAAAAIRAFIKSEVAMMRGCQPGSAAWARQGARPLSGFLRDHRTYFNKQARICFRRNLNAYRWIPAAS